MERSWGKEAVRFSRRHVPGLLATYEGKPADFLEEVSAAWKKYVAALQARMDALPKNVPDDTRMALASALTKPPKAPKPATAAQTKAAKAAAKAAAAAAAAKADKS